MTFITKEVKSVDVSIRDFEDADGYRVLVVPTPTEDPQSAGLMVQGSPSMLWACTALQLLYSACQDTPDSPILAHVLGETTLRLLLRALQTVTLTDIEHTSVALTLALLFSRPRLWRGRMHVLEEALGTEINVSGPACIFHGVLL